MFFNRPPGCRQVILNALKVATLLSILGLTPSGWAASKIHPFAERLQSAGNPRMTITRYAGQLDYHNNRSLIWEHKNGRFQQTDSMHHRSQIGFCETLLGAQQVFPLKKMTSTDYIRDQDVPEYIKMGESFDTNQVTFAQRSRDLPRAEALQMMGGDNEALRNRINPLLEDFGSRDVPFITATMWTVAGQVLEPHGGYIHNKQLPWQKDPLRTELAKNFDRRKYPFVWEWGRTAQDLPREMEPIGMALIAMNALDLIALGGDLDDAYVMFHSFDEVNTRAYSLRFPGTLWPSDWTNKADALFMVPLKQAMKAYSIAPASEKFTQLMEAVEGKLTEFETLRFLTEYLRIEYTQLDVHTKGRDGRSRLPRPLAMHDMSNGRLYRQTELLRKYGLDGVVDKARLARVLRDQRHFEPALDSGQYTDMADMDVSQYFYLDQNAIEFSNLDRAAALLDPFYIERTLLGAFYFYLKALMPGPFRPEKTEEMVRQMSRNGIKFGFTTFDPALAVRIRALKPSVEQKFEYEPLSFKPEFPGQPWLTMGYSQEPTAHLFTVQQVLDLARSHPALLPDSLNSTFEDVWARHLMFTNPDVF